MLNGGIVLKLRIRCNDHGFLLGISPRSVTFSIFSIYMYMYLEEINPPVCIAFSQEGPPCLYSTVGKNDGIITEKVAMNMTSYGGTYKVQFYEWWSGAFLGIF